MRSRPNSSDDLLGLGRSEDELHVRRRFLDDFQQRVEALRRDHVCLVDDVDLVARDGGCVGRLVTQLARIVDATMARGVDLDDVDAARAAARQVDGNSDTHRMAPVSAPSRS